MNPHAPHAPLPPARAISKLDLIKADTPLTPAKIARMLHQLEFKLQVEMQYRRGIDKMAKLYQAEGDKKSRADAEAKRVESEKKIQILNTALKRYKNLHVIEADADADDEAVGACVCIVLHLMLKCPPQIPPTATQRRISATSRSPANSKSPSRPAASCVRRTTNKFPSPLPT